MKIDHVHFYTRNAARTRDWFINHVGFKAIGNCISQDTHTELIALNSAYFAISSPLNIASPVAQYLKHHPSGVADLAFRVSNLEEVLNRVRSLGLKLFQKIQVWRSPQGKFKFAQIMGWNDLRHTLIETQEDLDYCVPIKLQQYENNYNWHSHITCIDHVVLNVAQDKLDYAVELYQTLFKFRVQQSFQIHTAHSGLASQALIDDSGVVQFNINEPTDPKSQIQEFIDLNGGSGIQHLALRSPNLITDVALMQQRGLDFLTVPPAYYLQLTQLVNLSPEEQQAICQQQILVDSDREVYPAGNGNDAYSLLMQIFTQPIFEQPTFFLEFIERRQEAQGFGQGNFQELFAAVEREQSKRFSARK